MGALCHCFFGCIGLVVISFAVLVMVPGAERQYIRLVDTHCTAYPPVKHGLYLFGQLTHAFEDGLGFAVPFLNPLLAHATDSHQSPGLLLSVNILHPVTGYGLHRVSHEAVRAVHYNPKAQRDPDRFVGVYVSQIPKGYFAPGVQPTLLQMNTDDPARYAHRDLAVATVPALAEFPPSVPDFALAPNVTGPDLVKEVKWHVTFPFPKFVPDLTQNIFAFNFFRHAFGIDLTYDEMHTLKEWTTIFSRVFLGASSEIGAKLSSKLAGIFFERIAASEFGRNFLAEAERRGMDGPGHLNKLIFQFVFAGFGGDGPGGSLMLLNVLKRIESDRGHYLPLFKRDPAAFVLESVRTKGGGGAGMNPSVVTETKTYTLPTGVVATEHAGDYAISIALQAGHDPAVFGGPNKTQEYTTRFLPGRENADRLLSFVGELRDIRKCPNMTGCEAAPRFCMGAFLAQRLVTQIATFYVESVEAIQLRSKGVSANIPSEL